MKLYLSRQFFPTKRSVLKLFLTAWTSLAGLSLEFKILSERTLVTVLNIIFWTTCFSHISYLVRRLRRWHYLRWSHLWTRLFLIYVCSISLMIFNCFKLLVWACAYILLSIQLILYETRLILSQIFCCGSLPYFPLCLCVAPLDSCSNITSKLV